MTALTLRRIALPFVLALFAGLVFSAGASATPLPGGSVFDSQDGDELTGPGVIKDWDDIVPTSRLSASADSVTSDDCFIGGTKEDTPSAWAFNPGGTGCTPGKSDLLGMWAHAEILADATNLHAAFVRRDPSGNTFVTFELNKRGTTWTNPKPTVIPCRSNGDLLIAYEIGGSTVDVTIFRWTGDGTGPPDLPAPAPPGCPNGANGSFTWSAAYQNGKINAAEIDNSLSPLTVGATIEPKLFGEAQINLATVLASMGVTGCFSYVQAQAHTRSSSSISSALIDNVRPVPARVANCAVTGTVYGDANSNALRDAGESGIAGRTVYLDKNANGSLDAATEPSASTGSDGDYVLPSDMTSGTYPVRVVIPSGSACTVPTPCVRSATFTAAGANTLDQDFGLFTPATVSGTVFVDDNANGIRDAGEDTPIANRTIYDDVNSNGSHDMSEASATTGADGSYTVGLPPGTARLSLAGGDGYVCDFPATGCRHTIVLVAGDALTGRDFLAYQAPTITGTVYTDADASAVQDAGEGGRGLVTVGLYDADGTTLRATTTTDGSGAYAFSTANFAAFKPGAYVIKVTPPAGFVCSAPCATPVTPTSGQELFPSTGVFTNATVTGTVFADDDRDGVKDVLETGALARTVYDDANDNGILDGGETFTTTAADGSYTLSLSPRSAHIRTVLTAADVCSGPSPCVHDLQLTSGASPTGQDFGIWTPSVVTGVVYADVDGDGTQGGAEPGLAARTVFADYDANGILDGVEPSTTTAGDGTYSLGGIRPGTAVIRVVISVPQTCTNPMNCSIPHLFTSGSTFGASFGIWVPASVSGRVYEDVDADATFDAGEPGLDARIVFDDVNDNGAPDGTEPQTTSAGDGTYTLGGLAPGMHRIRATLPAGFTRSEPGGPGAHTPTLISAQNAPAANFGGWRDATVRGHLYEDVDGDHAHQGTEPGLGGQAVQLYAADGTTLLATTATAGDGGYAFAGRMPATYVVRLALGGGYECSSPMPCTQTITVGSGLTSPGQDFTALRRATVSGTVFTDADGDGTQDPADTGKPGVVVYADVNGDLDRDGDEPTDTTDASGEYTLTGIPPGSVEVRVVPPAGFACSTQVDCDRTLTLVSGGSDTADFGVFEEATVTGHVTDDSDADGADALDSDLDGRLVWADLDHNGTHDPGEPFTTTDPDGDYVLPGLKPGSYTIRVELPAGWHCSPVCGTDVTLGSGDAPALDFAQWGEATIRGTVWEDTNLSGSRDGGEPGLGGRTVRLDLGADDSVDDTTTTDSDGSYAFDGLTPGLVRITVVAPAGFACTTPAPCEIDRTLTSDANSTGADFGLPAVADLSLAKSAPATVNQGETFAYTLTVTNHGPDAAQNAKIVDDLPGGVEFASADAGCDEVAGTVTCSLGTIAGGATPSRSITVRAMDAGDIDNSATVSSATGDPTPGNDDDDAEVSVTPVADLAIDKTGPADVDAGDSATYTLTVTNNGPSDATGVTLRDTLPEGLVFDADASDGGWSEVTPGVYELTVGALADGAGASANIVARAAHAFAETDQTNAAEVGSSTLDTTPGNDDDSVETTIGPSADLALTKSADDPSIAQGENVTYTLTVTNDGPSDASDVEVGDPLPAGMTFVSLGAPAGWTCATPSVGADGTVTCTSATLADGATATFSLVAKGSGDGAQANTASVDAATPDADGDDNADRADVDVAAVADVSITKTGPANVAAGANATYTLTASNAGPSTAHDVAIDDALPAGTTFVSLAAPGGVSCTTPAVGSAGSVQCSAATLADGDSIVLTLVVEAGFVLADQTLTNTATVTAATLDDDGSDNSASATTPVGPASDLRLDKAASVPALPQNHQLTYTLTATNDGPSDATNVTVSDPLPAGVSFVSASAGCDNASGTVTCDLGTIADGASASATITVTATANGDRVNTATVSSEHPDPDPSDNAGSATVLVGPTADLSIAKTGPATVPAGGELTYTLTAANHGPSAATGVTVTDHLPAGMAYVSSTASQGSCAAAGQTITCAVGSLADGVSATLTVTARAAFAIAGQTAINSATITGDQNDDDTADDEAVHPVNVGPAADLTFVKDAPDHVPAGGRLVYSLRVANAGPQTATNVVIADTLPAGVRFASATSTQGDCTAAGQTVTCTIGSVPVGGGAQVVLTVDVEAAAGHSIHNTAVASSHSTEIDPSSNSDDATTAVDAVPVAPAPAPAGTLTVEKTADAGNSAELGAPVAFTIRVAHASGGTAHGVVAIDQPSAPAAVDSVRPDRGTCSNLRCELGDLAPGDVVLIHVVMSPRRAGALTNSVSVFSNDGGEAKNAVADVQVVSHETQLKITKKASLRSVGAGKTVWYTITAKNIGRYAASKVKVCDMPAPKTAYVTVRGAKFSGGRPCWKVKLLKPGKSVSFRVKVRIFEGSQGPMSRTRAIVSASNAKPRRAVRDVRVVGRRAVRAGGVTG